MTIPLRNIVSKYVYLVRDLDILRDRPPLWSSARSLSRPRDTRTRETNDHRGEYTVLTGHSKSRPIRIQATRTESRPCDVFDPGGLQSGGEFQREQEWCKEKSRALPEQESTAGSCARVIGLL